MRHCQHRRQNPRREKAEASADTNEEEAQIDALVAQRHGLTPEEMAIVEGKA